jgi:hypothetical protein
MIIFARQKRSLQYKTELLSKIRRLLKKDDICLQICSEFGHEPDILDGIPIEFDSKLDVSAKTINAKIYLNDSLLDEAFKVIMRYVVHELVHAFQHMNKISMKDEHKEKDYLDRPDELEAFQVQIKYDAKHRGKDKAEEYVDDLIEYHEIPKKQKEEKKEELMEKVEN